LNDSTVRQSETVNDSTIAASFGNLSAFAKGNEETTVVETEDLRITFSTKGGFIQEAELRKYKTYRARGGG
jgi:YidC/Oxa1 family membrane protein insertase